MHTTQTFSSSSRSFDRRVVSWEPTAAGGGSATSLVVILARSPFLLSGGPLSLSSSDAGSLSKVSHRESCEGEIGGTAAICCIFGRLFDAFTHLIGMS